MSSLDNTSSDQNLKNAFDPSATCGVGSPVWAAKPPPGYLKAAAPLLTDLTSEAKDINVGLPDLVPTPPTKKARTSSHQFSVVTGSQNGDSGLSPSGFFVSDILNNQSPLRSEEELLDNWVYLIDMKDSKGTSGSVKDATARLERVFRDLQADVYALHKIGDYPNKKADFDVLNSVAAHMEFKLVTMDESTKKAKTIKG